MNDIDAGVILIILFCWAFTLLLTYQCGRMAGWAARDKHNKGHLPPRPLPPHAHLVDPMMAQAAAREMYDEKVWREKERDYSARPFPKAPGEKPPRDTGHLGTPMDRIPLRKASRGNGHETPYARKKRAAKPKGKA